MAKNFKILQKKNIDVLHIIVIWREIKSEQNVKIERDK